MEDNKKRESKKTSNLQWKRLKTNVNLGEDFINFILEPPTLQNIAIISIATTFWTNFEVTKKLNKQYFVFGTVIERECYRQLEERVLNHPNKSFLPDSLKSEVSNIIRPIGLQLSKWFNDEFQEYCSLKELRQLGCSIYWTMEGTVNKIKSLEELIKKGNPNTDICKLYKLACKYCMEEYISDLWKKIPPHRKSEFCYINDCKNVEDFILVYWTSAVKNKLFKVSRRIRSNGFSLYDPNLNAYQNMISASVFVGNPFALEYFWKKLTEAEIKINIKKWLEQIVKKIASLSERYTHLDYNSYTYSLCFLLSHSIGKYQLKEFLQNHSYVILKSLFRSWPFQKFFLSTIFTMINFLEENVYVSIMTDVAERIGMERNIEIIFREIWSVSPSILKNAFLEGSDVECLRSRVIKVLLGLLKVADIYTTLIILNDTTSKMKELIAYHLIRDPDFKEILTSKKDLNFTDPLLKKVLPADGSIQSFRLGVVLYFTDECPLCYKLIDKSDYGAVETLLGWALESVSEIQTFKRTHLDPIRICTLICHNDYDHINRFLKWYFESGEEIRKFESAFLCENDSCHLREVLLGFACHWDGWCRFEKFENISLFASENRIKFKRMCLDCVKNVVEKRYFAFASRLLNRFLDDHQEINRFKKDLLFSESGVKMIALSDLSSWEGAEDLIVWASPLSRETATALRLTLIHNKEHWDGYGREWNRKRQQARK